MVDLDAITSTTRLSLTKAGSRAVPTVAIQTGRPPASIR